MLCTVQFLHGFSFFKIESKLVCGFSQYMYLKQIMGFWCNANFHHNGIDFCAMKKREEREVTLINFASCSTQFNELPFRIYIKTSRLEAAGSLTGYWSVGNATAAEWGRSSLFFYMCGYCHVSYHQLLSNRDTEMCNRYTSIVVTQSFRMRIPASHCHRPLNGTRPQC